MFYSGFFKGNCYFVDDESQNFLMVQPVLKYFAILASDDKVLAWASKGFSEEIIRSPATSDNIPAPKLTFIYNKKM